MSGRDELVLSHRYLLGFEPGKVKSNAGKDWRALRVELTDKKYRVRALSPSVRRATLRA